jgi:hypothetical protein
MSCIEIHSGICLFIQFAETRRWARGRSFQPRVLTEVDAQQPVLYFIFIFVGCILLRRITTIYINVPSIATEMFFFIYYNLIHHNMFRPLTGHLQVELHAAFLPGSGYSEKLNSMVWVRGQRVSRGQRDGSLRPYSRSSRQEPLLFN